MEVVWIYDVMVDCYMLYGYWLIELLCVSVKVCVCFVMDVFDVV